MGLNFYYYDGLQPKMSAGIINENECNIYKQNMHILNDMECFKDFPIGKCVLHISKSILNSMRSDFSYQYYFIDFSFEENSDKEPGGYIPKLSRHLSAQNILHKSLSWIQNLTF